MKILIVTDAFPPHCGGSGWSTYYLCKALREKEHSITVVMPGEKKKKRKYDDFSVFSVNHPLGKEFVHKAMEKKIRQLIRSNKFDLIHAQHIISVRAIANIDHIPKIATIRDYWPLCYDGLMYSLIKKKNVSVAGLMYSFVNLNHNLKGISKIFAFPLSVYAHLRTRLAMSSLKMMDKIICVSEFVKKQLVPNIDSKKLINIPNMIDVKKNKEYVSDTKKDDLLFVGKLYPAKGADILIKAMKGLDQKLMVVGEGKLKSYIEEYGKTNDIDVEFKGYLDNSKILHLMSENIIAIPSIWHEPLGRVHLEALSVGAKIITTSTGGTPEIIEDGYNGLIFDGTSEDLHEKITRLISDKQLQERLSKNALKTAKEKFDKNVLIQRYEKLYGELIDKTQ